MDHEVEHRADVDRAAGVGPVPFGLDELGRIGRFRSSSKAGLKRSMCPTWNGTPAESAKRDEIIRLGHRAANRFLDEDRHAGLEKGGSDRVVMNGRRHDADGVHALRRGSIDS